MRKVLLAMIGLTAVIVAVFCSYSSAFGKPAAHHIPVAVAASPAVLATLETSPALRVYQVRDLAVARSMVEDRAVYGGLVIARSGQATLVVANGGGHAVETALVQLGQQAAGTALNTVDVARTSPGDPNGLVEFYCVVFLGIGAAVGATILARTLGPVPHLRGALKRLGLLMMHTALLSAAITLFTDVVYGALAGHFWFLFLTLWLYVVAVCLAITGVAELVGTASIDRAHRLVHRLRQHQLRRSGPPPAARRLLLRTEPGAAAGSRAVRAARRPVLRRPRNRYRAAVPGDLGRGGPGLAGRRGPEGVTSPSRRDRRPGDGHDMKAYKD